MPMAVTGRFVKLMSPTSQLLPFLTYFSSKILPWFLTPEGHARSNMAMPIERSWIQHISGGATSYISPFSKRFKSKELLPWPSTCQGHPNWSPWALFVISVESNIVTAAVLDIFTSTSMTLIFDPSQCHPKSNLTVPIESPWVLHICSTKLVCVTVFDIFQVKILTWTLDTSGSSKVKLGASKLGTGLQQAPLCHPAKF